MDPGLKMNSSKTERPPGYWEKLFEGKKGGNQHLKECIEGVLEADIHLFATIMEKISSQAHMIKTVKKISPAYWVLGIEEESEFGDPVDVNFRVIEHEEAQSVLELFYSYNLPHHFPDGEPIPKVTNFHDLTQYMSRFNPYWLLELSSFMLSGIDFTDGEPNPDFAYDVNLGEMAIIRQELAKLQEIL